MKLNVWKASTLVLAGALALVVGGLGSVDAAPQPAMRLALDKLGEAKAALDAAKPDKGGHRVKALGLIATAMDEVKAGMDAADAGDKAKAADKPKAPDPAPANPPDPPQKPKTSRVANPK